MLAVLDTKIKDYARLHSNTSIKDLFKGIFLNDYLSEKRVKSFEINGKYYRIEKETWLQKFVMDELRGFSESRWNDYFTYHLTLRSSVENKYYIDDVLKEKNHKENILPVCWSVLEENKARNKFVITESKKGLESIVDVIKRSEENKQLKIIKNLGRALRNLHDSNIIYCDPTLFTISYIDNQSPSSNDIYFTYLNYSIDARSPYAPKNGKARDFLQLIISASKNSKLSIQKSAELFSQGYFWDSWYKHTEDHIMAKMQNDLHDINKYDKLNRLSWINPFRIISDYLSFYSSPWNMNKYKKEISLILSSKFISK